jgi:sec-independent protein translocase protein TatC
MASDNESMTFWEHLEELRQRIIRSTIAICICVFASLIFIHPIEKVLLFPIKTSINSLLAASIDRALGSEGSTMAFVSIAMKAQGAGIDVTLINIGPLASIMAFFKIGLTAGFLLASPILLYQLWAYIFPALTQREKKMALPLFLIIVLFFSCRYGFRLLHRCTGCPAIRSWSLVRNGSDVGPRAVCRFYHPVALGIRHCV